MSITPFNLPPLPKQEKVQTQQVPVPQGAGPGQSALALGLGSIGAGLTGNPGFLNAIAATLQAQQAQIQQAEQTNVALAAQAQRANVQIANSAAMAKYQTDAGAVISRLSDERRFAHDRSLDHPAVHPEARSRPGGLIHEFGDREVVDEASRAVHPGPDQEGHRKHDAAAENEEFELFSIHFGALVPGV